MSTHRLRRLNAVLLLALFAGSAWAYPRLPGRIPMHFGFSGQPDAWASRSLVSWFLLPAITAALALGLHAIAASTANHPELWNVPDKRRFLALDAAARAPIVAKLREFVAFVGVVVTALMLVIQAAIYRAATGTAPGLPVWAMAAVGVALLVMIAASVRLNAAVGRMVNDAYAGAAD
jgi:uncharacterized membrane protein